jgi:SLT domain-containing protein
MAIAVVERAVNETGVPAEIEVVDVTSEAQARKFLFPGSPTVRVEGRDVDRTLNGQIEFTLDDRLYRTDRGLAGWPDERWVREALLLAVAQTNTNGNHESSSRSSATSP